jgi:UDP-2,3-diacylglucosamine pyrophosphatase LpxH
MLVFISDLHFTDGTSGDYNIKKRAFDGFFDDLAIHAKKAKEVKLIFLGDIFDLLRTEKWFSFDEDECPWGTDEVRIEKNANDILKSVISKNQSTFDIFKAQNLKDTHGLFIKEVIYIPGNHDRLCNKYESLRILVRENLGITGKKAGDKFDYCYSDQEYGVMARHGSEFDCYNYEGKNYEGKDHESFEDHILVPIGDPITTLLLAKLPWAVKNRLEIENFPSADVKQIYGNFQDIENVRPLESVIIWLFNQVQTFRDRDDKLEDIISDVIKEVIEDFENLNFVQKWYDKHDKRSLFDEADKAQTVLWMLKKLKFDSIEHVLSFIDYIKKLSLEGDKYIKAATNEKPFDDVRQFHVVYGHTHEPKQLPIQKLIDLNHVYLNTGTWRARHRCCENKKGFITWKDLTYVILYNKDESPLGHPSFETWSGNLKDED